MPTLIEKKRREKWETELRVAELQAKSLMNDCHVFENNLAALLKRYKIWLTNHNMEPTVNLEYYDKIK